MKKLFRLGPSLKVAITIFCSRISGFVRDMCLAAFVGAGPLNDAFLAAFKLTNIFRSIFGEGAMNSAVVPAISQSMKSHGERYTRVIKFHVLTILLLSLVAFTILVFYGMESIILITNPGFANNHTIFELAVDLAYINFPYLTFISLAAFYGAVLHTKGIFVPYAATPLILNFVMIGFSYLCFLNSCSSQVHALSYSVIVAGILELLWMVFFARRYGIHLRLRKPIMSRYVKKILMRILPGIIGSGMVQISVWCDMIILSFFSGGISYLYFADRVLQLPLAIFGTAAATVLLPLLSRVDDASRHEAFNKAFRSTACLIIPSAVGLSLTSEEVVILLFNRGAFTLEAAEKTSLILRILCLALPCQALSKIYTAALHSRGEMKKPMYFAFCSLVVNLSMSFLLMKNFGYTCVAIASVLSSAAQLLLLARSCGESLSSESRKDIMNYLMSSVLMGLVILCLKLALKGKSNFMQVFLFILCGGLTYIVFLTTRRVKILKDFFSRS